MASAQPIKLVFRTCLHLLGVFTGAALLCASGASVVWSFEKSTQQFQRYVVPVLSESGTRRVHSFDDRQPVDLKNLQLPIRENLWRVWVSLRQAAALKNSDSFAGVVTEPKWRSLNGQNELRVSQLDGPSKDRTRDGNQHPVSGQVYRPTVSNVLLGVRGGARIAGTCAPRLTVQIDIDGQVQHAVRCNGSGRFLVIVEQGLGEGDHVLSTSVKPNAGDEQSGQDVRVYVPEGYSGNFTGLTNGDDFLADKTPIEGQHDNGEQLADSDVRDYAEALARDASDRFSQLTLPEVGVNDSSQTSTGNKSGDDGSNDKGKPNSSQVSIYSQATRAVDWLKAWQAYSTKIYFREVVPKLTGADGLLVGEDALGIRRSNSSATIVNIPLPERPEGGAGFEAIRIDVRSYWLAASNWIENSYIQYREKIVRKLSVGDGSFGDIRVAKNEDNSKLKTSEQRSEDTKQGAVEQTRETLSPPPGRLAKTGQIAESTAVSKRETSRLDKEWSSGSGRSATVVQDEKDKIRLEKERVEDEKRTAQKRDEALEEKEEQERLARERARDAQRSDQNWMAERLRVQEAEKAKESEQETPQKTLKDTLDLEKKKLEVRPQSNRHEMKHEASPGGVVQHLPERNSERRDIRADVFALPTRKPERKLKKFAGSRIGLPIRKPDRRVSVIPEGRSALGARAVALKVEKANKKSASTQTRTKVARASRVQRAKKKRSAAVRSYRKRRKVGRKRRSRKLRRARSYIVRRGDTLWDIARRYYGAGHRYRLIHRANRGKIRNPHKIRPRQRLRLPRVKR